MCYNMTQHSRVCVKMRPVPASTFPSFPQFQVSPSSDGPCMCCFKRFMLMQFKLAEQLARIVPTTPICSAPRITSCLHLPVTVLRVCACFCVCVCVFSEPFESQLEIHPFTSKTFAACFLNTETFPQYHHSTGVKIRKLNIDTVLFYTFIIIIRSP